MLHSVSVTPSRFWCREHLQFWAVLCVVSAFHGALVFSLWPDQREILQSPEAVRMVARTIVLPVLPPPKPAPPALPAPPVARAKADAPVARPVSPPKYVAPQRSPATAKPLPVPQGVAAPSRAERSAALPVESGRAADSEPPPAPAAPVQELPPRYDVAYLQNPAPEYPVLSRRRREQGTVQLRVWVSASGMPDRLEVVESSGFARLDEAAKRTVSQWRFVPARRGDTAVAAEVVVPVVFVLKQ